MGGIEADFCSTHKMKSSECFHLHYPDAHRKIGWPAWTAQENDIVGGWVVTTYPHSLSEHEKKDKIRGGYVIAKCMTESDACAIATLLNREGFVPDDAKENSSHWRWVSAGYLEGSERQIPLEERVYGFQHDEG